MKNIRPSADLRNRYAEMSSLCKEEGAVYITVNGRSDTVLVDDAEYSRMKSRLELYELLAEGEEDEKLGRVYSQKEVLEDFRQRLKKLEENNE
jgi:PHD/YefM family antitoxin component YafN of YafNO toxin-antitoxin module